MPKRRGHAVSGCHDGIRERPAAGDVREAQVENLCYGVVITKPTSSLPSGAGSRHGGGPPSSPPSGPIE